jgi:hypothetical protein
MKFPASEGHYRVHKRALLFFIWAKWIQSYLFKIHFSISSHPHNGIHLSTRKRDISLLHNVDTGSEARPTSYPMGAGSYFSRGVKQPGREADYSHLYIAEVRNAWNYTPPYVVMTGCLIKYRGNF